MSPIADYILLLMKQQTDTILASDEELQHFLTWINTKSSVAYITYYTKTVIRAFYFEFACRPYLFYPLEDLIPSVFTQALKEEFNFIFINLDIEFNFLRYDETALDVRLLKIFNGLCQGYIDDVDLGEALEILERIHGDIDLYKLLQKIELKSKQIKANTNKAECKQWFKNNGYTWAEELIDILIKYRNIGYEWQFNDCQQQLLQQYYQANKLLVECLNSGCNVSPKVRQEIEQTLLLPKDEIERRKAEGKRTSGS
jgi:predicted NACHT family NTPase